ncbi:MAG: hypothetical protein ACKODP_03985 [Actinomycetota bacterium]
MTLTCAEARATLLSAVADADKRTEAQRHILSCEMCAPPPSELDEQVSTIERFIRGRRGVRAVLAIAGLLQLSLALPWLAGNHSWWDTRSSIADLHLTRDGMIALVISVAALIGAASRRFAWFCVVPTLLTVAVQAATSLLDNRNNDVTVGFEWIHLLGVVIVVLLVLEVLPTRGGGPAGH